MYMCKNVSIYPRRDRGNLAEIAPRSARSRRDSHDRGEISKYRAEKSRPRRDRAEIGEISAR